MEKPPFIQALADYSPDLLTDVDRIMGFLHTDSALPSKIKLLMAALIDALKNHQEGVKALIGMAKGKGATDDEIRDTMRIALCCDGIPGLVAITAPFRKE